MIHRSVSLLIALLLLCFSASAQPIVSGNRVTFTDASGNTISAGDNANNALRVNCVTGCSSSAANFGSAMPSTGQAMGFTDGTNMRAASVADIDSGAGAQYAQIISLRRTASGGGAELIGQSTMANSLPVALASDQSALPVSQSGVTPWLVAAGERNGCGNTYFESAWAAVPTSNTTVTGTTSCVVAIYVTNTNATPQTILVTDGQGSPITIVPTVSIPGNSVVPIPLARTKFVSGVKWQAGGAGVTGAVVAWQ